MFGACQEFSLYDLARSGNWYDFGFVVGAGSPSWARLGRKAGGSANPIDDAILAARPVDTVETARLGELPYDFQRRLLSVLVSIGQEQVLLTKGAVESVLARCRTVEPGDGTSVPLEQAQATIQRRFEELSAQGYRVLGVAHKRLAATVPLSLAEESDLAFPGVCDPPRSAEGGDRSHPAGVGGARHLSAHGHRRQSLGGGPHGP